MTHVDTVCNDVNATDGLQSFYVHFPSVFGFCLLRFWLVSPERLTPLGAPGFSFLHRLKFGWNGL